MSTDQKELKGRIMHAIASNTTPKGSVFDLADTISKIVDTFYVIPTATQAPSAPVDVCAHMRALCSACGGTGDVTSIVGEWLGSCDCPASAPVAPDERAAFEADFRKRNQIPDFVSFNGLHETLVGEAWASWQARAALSVKVEPAAAPAGYALTLIEQSYDQRVKAIIAHNQCRGDLDDKLKAAYEAAVYASPTPPHSGETPP